MGSAGLAGGSRVVLTTIVGVTIFLWGTQAISSPPTGFELGFHNPLDPTELSWTAQPDATGYQLLRSSTMGFSADCAMFETTELFQVDPAEPLSSGVFCYLVRELTPVPGGWGTESDGTPRAISCMAPSGGLVSSSGCNGRQTAAGSRLTPDCIEYEYLGEGTLLLNHLNTAFNCCPEFEAGVDVEENTITVWEDEISGDCDCTCLFDLGYEIVNLDLGVYEVTVIQEYLDPHDEPLDFTIDLLSSPSGIHCVERDHYPW